MMILYKIIHSENTFNTDMEITVMGGINQTKPEYEKIGARPKEGMQRDL